MIFKDCIQVKIVNTNTDYIFDENGFIEIQDATGYRCKLQTRYISHLSEYSEISSFNIDTFSYTEINNSDWIKNYNLLIKNLDYIVEGFEIINAIVDEDGNICHLDDTEFFESDEVLKELNDKFSVATKYNAKAKLSNSNLVTLLDREINLIIRDCSDKLVIPRIIEDIQFDNIKNPKTNKNSRIGELNKVKQLRFLAKIFIPESFMEDYNLEELFISNAIGIDKYAFKNCSKLRNLSINSSNIEIRSEAFKDSGIEIIDFGESLGRIGYNAFANCKNIKNLEIPSCLSIGNGAFENSGIERVKFTGQISELKNSIFKNCVNLKYLELYNDLTRISGEMFYGCKNLTEIYIPKNVEYIGEQAFYGCNLKHIKISKDLKNQFNKIDGLAENCIIETY